MSQNTRRRIGRMWCVCDSKVSTLPATVCKRGITIFDNVSSMQDGSDTKNVFPRHHIIHCESCANSTLECPLCSQFIIAPIRIFARFSLHKQTSIALLFDKLFNLTKHLM